MAGRRDVPCPYDDSIVGYTSIAHLNADIQEEIDRIENVPILQPESSYIYTLCPHTVFVGDERLTPLLDNSTFLCGNMGDSKDKCTLMGGSVQVNIIDSPYQYQINRLFFRGLTFSNFTSYGVAASASSQTRAEFHDCHWRVSHEFF